MATSSITKDFYVKDKKAFEKLKEDLDRSPQRKNTTDSPSLKKGKEKLTTFVFR